MNDPNTAFELHNISQFKHTLIELNMQCLEMEMIDHYAPFDEDQQHQQMFEDSKQSEREK